MTEEGLRLYHERAEHRNPTNGEIGPGDEEDCYTPAGRRKGVWLTTEAMRGASVVSCTIDPALLAEYEVTAEGDEHRTFVVPGSLTSTLSFS